MRPVPTAEPLADEAILRNDRTFGPTAELLDAELPDPRFHADRYLRWLYVDNPLGEGFWCDAEEGGVRVAHYGLTRMLYRDREGDVPCVFSLNACTRSTVHRKGWFRTLARDVYERAGDAGRLGVIGVTNARSTKPVVTALDFRLLGPMPVTVVPRRGSGPGVESSTVDAALLADGAWQAVARGLDAHPAHGWTNRYTPAHLAWRLASPDSAPYVVHVGDEVVAVSTVDHAGPVPMAVVLKLLPRDGRRGPLRSRAVIDAACAFHGAPAAVYAGWNAHVPVRGVRPPRRLQPSPLNLVYRSTSPERPVETFVLDTWEFLDMDAY
jgi:hypothetical protein